MSAATDIHNIFLLQIRSPLSKDFHYCLVIMYKTPVIILTLFSSKVNLHSKKTYFSQYTCLFCRFSRFFQYFFLHNFIVYAKFDSIRVNDLYLGEQSVCVSTSLEGPGSGKNTESEIGAETVSYPYIVIKLETLDAPVIFDIQRPGYIGKMLSNFAYTMKL